MAEDYDVEVAELQAIADGDKEAFCRWFARCEIPLKRSLRSFAQAVDVEAVVQETGLKLWKDPSRITPDGRTGFLLRWGITVARNEARNHVKRTGRQVAFEEHPEVAGATVNMAGDPEVAGPGSANVSSTCRPISSALFRRASTMAASARIATSPRRLA